MKNTRFSLLAVLLCLTFSLAAQQIRYDRVDFQEDPEWSKVLAQARRTGKVIFFDGYTTWCGPCKMMDRDVFTQAQVANYFNQKFINVKYDMEKDEGVELKTRFGVRAFPTYLFITGSGQIIHKIVGAYTKDGEFLTYSRLAVTPGESNAALQARYDAGERNSELMFNYLRSLRLAGNQSMEQEIATEYLKLMSKDHLMDPAYWDIVKYFLKDPASPKFHTLMENRDEIATAIGAEEVDSKIYQVFDERIKQNSHFYPGEGATFDRENEEAMIQLLRDSDFPVRNELLSRALVIRHNRIGDYDEYAATVDAMLDYRLLNTHPEPLKQFDHYASTFAKVVVEPRLLRKALRWSEYACENETHPEEQAFFLKTKADLLEKLGDAPGAQDAKSAADAAEKKAEEIKDEK